MKIVFGLGSTSVMSIPLEWANGLIARGHQVTVIESARHPASFIVKLRRHIRWERPDIVHLHHTMPALSSMFVSRRSGSPPIVLTLHRLVDDMSLASRVAHFLAANRVDAVVANSMATLASLPASVTSRSQRCRTIYNGVDLARLDAVQPATVRPVGHPLRIVSVGRLIPEKGFDTLIRAMSHVRAEKLGPVTLTIVGDGPLLPRMRSLVAEEELTDIVTFAGRLTREKVYALLWNSDLFALSSRTEGFCNAAVEAMAAGLSVVVTPAGALPEVVGEHAWIAAGIDAQAYSNALKAAIAAPEIARRARGEAGAKRARSLFTLDRTIESYEGLYAELTAGEADAR